MSYTTSHHWLCFYCGRTPYEEALHGPCRGMSELRTATALIVRVAEISPDEGKPWEADDHWHVQQHEDGSRTYSIVVRPKTEARNAE